MRGALWSKWDLHVHTPSSIVQNYGGEQNWPRYLDELEKLDKNINVLGINDYWFLDGYEKLVHEKSKGRLANIACIFPVIEMRLSHLAGANENLKKLNLHVLFDPAISVETIRSQFISRISPSIKLDAGEEAAWNGVITKQSITDFGKSIIANAPADQRHTYDPPLKTGFNNLVVSLDSVLTALGSHYFKNRYLLILGRAEWANMKWEATSAATKRDVINRCDLVFSAFEDTSKWPSRRSELTKAGVTSKIIDCSDAHDWPDSGQPTRLGNCDTWMRTIPTFRGLLHAIEEFDSRVYVGPKPPDLLSQESRSNHIISALSTHPTQTEAIDPISIRYQVDLNPRFTVVVGNKGQGKSAFLDLIALGGNSSRVTDFAFLNTKRFLRPSNKEAARISVTISWATGLTRTVQINQGHSASDVEEVEYLPQSLIEKVCSSDPDSPASHEFEAELRSVLFTHIPPSEREGATAFDEILELRLKALDPRLRIRRAEVRAEVDDYLGLLNEQAQLNLHALQGQEAQILKSIEAATEQRDLAKADLDTAAVGADADTLELRQRLYSTHESLVQIDEKMIQSRNEAAGYASKLRTLDEIVRRCQDLDTTVQSINHDYEGVKGLVGEDTDSPLVVVKIDQPAIDAIKSTLIVRQNVLGETAARYAEKQEELRALLAEVSNDLAIGDSARELKRAHLDAIEQRISSLNGNASEPHTLAGVRALIDRANLLPEVIISAEDNLTRNIEAIHSILTERLSVYRELYKPAAQFVTENPLAAQVGFEFSANLIVSSWDSFLEGLDSRRNAGLITYLETARVSVEPQERESVLDTIHEILNRLRREGGNQQGTLRNPSLATKKAVSIADYLQRIVSLRWLDTQLTITKDGQLLEQLSPGQRGLILLLFYLIVDNSTRPLLLDQPEENLDNEAIKTSLVPAIQAASQRRQIILVTHNANLAIVGDADQIIHTTIDADRVFHITGGGLAEFSIGEASIDVLEGARPAFANRKNKYETIVVNSEP